MPYNFIRIKLYGIFLVIGFKPHIFKICSFIRIEYIIYIEHQKYRIYIILPAFPDNVIILLNTKIHTAVNSRNAKIEKNSCVIKQ